MRPQSCLLLLAATLLPSGALAGKPKLSETKFDNEPGALFYFEDSSTLLELDAQARDVWRSTNDGKEWKKLDEAKGKAVDVMEHPFDKEKAIILTAEKEHYVTSDKGETWRKFSVELPPSVRQLPVVFNAKNPDYVMYNGRDCEKWDFIGLNCKDKTYYTKDWFKSDPKLLVENTHMCTFARGNKLFDQAEDATTLCIVDGKNKLPESRKLMISHDFFANSEEPELDGQNTVQGVAGIASITKFLVAAVRSIGSDEMALYVSNDAKTWDRAEFPQDHGGLKEDAYTILESTPYSIQVDVLNTGPLRGPMGELFTSNSNGTYFTRNIENTNRITKGLVDFEQIAGIDGIVMANVIQNADEVKKSYKVTKKLQSKISFDDGKAETWKDLKTGSDKLHLHSVTELNNLGRVFSSRAPGVLMGVGNTGDILKDYNDGDLYVSEDAGLTWTKTRDGAHKYEFGGSGSIIIAVFDEGFTNKVSFSKNHGKDWEDFDLGMDIRAKILTTTPDSTSLKFILVGETKDHKTHIFALDFEDIFDGKKCNLDKDHEDKSDYEKWYARLDNDGKPDCLMGRKQFFWRRKKDANCNAGELYKEPDAEVEVCECTDQDFECDFNFVKTKDGKCEVAPNTKLPIPADQCKNPKDKYMGSSGYRKIPGNSCKGGKDLEKKVEHECKDAISTPSTGKIFSKSNEFKAKLSLEYFYLDTAETAASEEETIIMMTEKQELFVSHDGGKEWKQILKDVKVIAVYPHPYQYNHVYFVTNTKKIHYTTDRAHNFNEIEAPLMPNRKNLPFLEFHPRKPSWFIWHGEKDCTSSLHCHTSTFYTKSGGEDWKSLKTYTGMCRWVRGQREQTAESLIFCEHEAKEGDDNSDTMELISSTNFFDDETKHFDKIIGFASMQEFLVVAGVKEDNSLKASASIDGKSFADAHFPYGFNVPHQTAYTVLDSVTHSVLLHVTVNDQRGFEFGSLLKSNSNGTNYVLSLDAVNRNSDGFVDFEKMQSLEGIAIANRVENWKDALKGTKKKLRTMITHNDGGRWKYITPPEKDAEGKPYSCSGNLEKCSLNLHHYTERTDPRHTFSSGSAIGLMLAVGNVGDELKGFADGDTFMTTDGGHSWKEVKKGQYLWEFGDQGSIIVIVDRSKATDVVHYTLNEGKDWQEYKFGEKLKITDISTVPADNSRKFLLWGYKEGGREKFSTVHLDFTGITNVQCILDDSSGTESETDDFFLWSPSNANQADSDSCLFGHVAQYHRKLPDHRCFIGRKLERFHSTLKNCSCTPEDYECDFNYQRASDGTCKLVAGLDPPDHKKEMCAAKDAVEYFLPTGYRRLPMTTCEGGRELDKMESLPCPGKDEEYNKKHGGLGGFGLFMAIVIPIGAAAGVGYWVWTRVLGNHFGAIRLGEERENRVVEYLIIGVSGVVAVVLAVPSILAAIGGWIGRVTQRWRGGQRRYTTRSSLRGRGEYSIVADDEGELLGDSDEEDV